MFHVCLRRTCILLLLDRIFCSCLLGLFGVKCSSGQLFLQGFFCLYNLFNVARGVFESPTHIVLLYISPFTSVFPLYTQEFQCLMHIYLLLLYPLYKPHYHYITTFFVSCDSFSLKFILSDITIATSDSILIII